MATHEIEVETTVHIDIDEGHLAQMIHDEMYENDLLKTADEHDNVPWSAARSAHRNIMIGIAKNIAEELELS